MNKSKFDKTKKENSSLFVIISLFLILILSASFIKIEFNYNSNIFNDVFIALITILLTFLLVIRQLFFNRIESNPLYKINEKIIWFETIMLIIIVVLNSLEFYKNNLLFFLLMVVSLILFIITLFIIIHKSTTTNVITSKVNKVVNSVKRQGKVQNQLSGLKKIYINSLTKKETFINLLIIDKYTELINDFLCDKNNFILKNDVNKEDIKSLKTDLIYFYLKLIACENDENAIEINKHIIISLIILKINARKISDLDLNDIINDVITQLFIVDLPLDNLNRYFKIFIVNLNGDPNDLDLKNFDVENLEFSIVLFKKIIIKRKFSDLIEILFYFYSLYDNEDVKNLTNSTYNDFFGTLKYVILEMNYNDNLFSFLDQLDSSFYKNDFYNIILDFYNDLINYNEFYKNDQKINSWLLFLNKLISLKRIKYTDNIITLYFDIISASIYSNQIMANLVIPQIPMCNYQNYLSNIKDILFRNIVKDRKDYITYILMDLNEYEFNVKNVKEKEKIYNLYFNILLESLYSNHTNQIHTIIDKFHKLIIEDDKNLAISSVLGNKILDNLITLLDGLLQLDIDSDCDLFAEIYRLLDIKTDLHFIKQIKFEFMKQIFNLGLTSIEYQNDAYIKNVSNILAWESKYYVDLNNEDRAFEIYEYGRKIFETLVAINYNENIIVFVGTFMSTILCYVLSQEDKNKKWINCVNNLIKLFDNNMKLYLIKSINLRKYSVDIWSSNLKIDLNKGYKKLEKILNGSGR